MNNEDIILEQTLMIAEQKGYKEAYRYLEQEKQLLENEECPQVYYFLACLAVGSGQKELALQWLEEAIEKKGFWYRTEVLEDEDLMGIFENDRFILLKQQSDRRYQEEQKKARAFSTWKQKEKERLLLVVHGNGQNAAIAKDTWKQVSVENLQVEAVQSAIVDSYGRYRWEYDEKNYLQFYKVVKQMASKEYQSVSLGGFSAGCDMILRTIVRTEVVCESVILQSPWIPIIETELEAVCLSFLQKKIALYIFCGEEDVDCKDMAQKLYNMAKKVGVKVILQWQEGIRHQFPSRLGIEYELAITKKDEILLILTEKWCDWEASYAIAVLHSFSAYNVKTIAIDQETKQSMGGIQASVDYTIKEYSNFNHLAMVILPGGLSWENDDYDEIAVFIQKLIERTIPLAAICGACYFLGKHGFLNEIRHTVDSLEMFKKVKNYKGEKLFLPEKIVVDQGIITAKETAAIEFAYEIFKLLKVDSEEELQIWFEKFSRAF